MKKKTCEKKSFYILLTFLLFAIALLVAARWDPTVAP